MSLKLLMRRYLVLDVRFIASGWTAFIYGMPFLIIAILSIYFHLVLKGSISIGSDPKPIYEAFHTVVLSSEEDQSGVAVSTVEKETELVIIAGEPLNQTVFQYGPFVMTNKQEIVNTLEDCKQMYCDSMYMLISALDREGKNGFEKAHTWKSIIGNQ